MTGQMHERAFGMLRHPARGQCRRRPRLAVGRRLMLLVALTGLMAMHGLSDHGLGGPVAIAHTPSTMPAGGIAGDPGDLGNPGPVERLSHANKVSAGTLIRAMGTNPGAEAGHFDTRLGGTSQQGGHERHGGQGGHDGVLAGMCMAILAALLLLAAVGWWRRPLCTLAAAFGDLTTSSVTALLARSRGPAPPDLRLLSIQRC